MTKQLSKSVLATLAVATSLVGCSGSRNSTTSAIPKNKLVHRAPQSEAETGVTVSGLTDQEAADLVTQNENLKIRVINPKHNLYEVYGDSQAVIRSQIKKANVVVEKNHFVKLQKVTAATETDSTPELSLDELTELMVNAKHPFVQIIENYQGVKLSGVPLDFVSSCKLNQITAPIINLESDKGLDATGSSLFMDIEESVKISAANSKPNGTLKKPLSYMWVMRAPEDSKLDAKINFTSELSYKSDTTGLHIFSVVAKDELGFCQIEMQPLYVSANFAFSPSAPFPDSASNTIDQNTFWHVFHVGAKAMWQQAVGSGLVVGIVDTGVDYNHPALSTNILVNDLEVAGNGLDDDFNGLVDDVAGYDFSQNDGSPFDDDGHGTHVAGIAASSLFGAARKASILPVKAGSGLGFDLASTAGAIRYAVDSGAKVVNMSFGSGYASEVIQSAIDYTEEKGALVIAAAGNDGTSNDDEPKFPSDFTNKNIISVAATDENDNLTSYSNFGSSVDIAAPGGTLQKPIISASRKNPRDNQFVGMSGTSMASPLVAGVAAQVWSANPGLNALQIKQILLDSGKTAPGLEGKVASGKVVDATRALANAVGTRPESSLHP